VPIAGDLLISLLTAAAAAAFSLLLFLLQLIKPDFSNFDKAQPAHCCCCCIFPAAFTAAADQAWLQQL
jgi:hypothetical protein